MKIDSTRAGTATVQGIMKEGTKFGPFSFNKFHADVGVLTFVNSSDNSALRVRDADVLVMEVIHGLDLVFGEIM